MTVVQPTDSDVLHGWKDIAAFTGKSVRTVQRWENELGFPVRRLGPDREIVIALRSEVSEWLRRPGGAPLQGDADAQAGPGYGPAPRQDTPPAPPTALRGRRWAAGLALLVAAIAVLAWHDREWPAAQPPGQPASWSVTAHELSVFDPLGRTLWTYTSQGTLNAPYYEARKQAVPSQEPVRFVDLEGDGQIETVFVEALLNSTGIGLVVFDAGGERRFAHSPRAVRFGATEYAGPWVLAHMQTSVARDGRVTLWPAFLHRPWFPSVVEELEADGAVRREYWSNGHITLVNVTSRGDREVVIVGSGHNDSGGVSVAVMDRDRLGGAAPAADVRYRCASCDPGHPEVFLVFPRLCLAGGAGYLPWVKEAWFDASGRLLVEVQHGLERAPNGAVLYSIDPTYSDGSADLMPGYAEAHRALERSGALDHAFGPEDVAAALPVRKWDGTALVPLATGKAAAPR